MDWLIKIVFRGYDRAVAGAFRNVVAQYARGNVSVQSGRFLSPSDKKAFILRGDDAFQKLNKKFAGSVSPNASPE